MTRKPVAENEVELQCDGCGRVLYRLHEEDAEDYQPDDLTPLNGLEYCPGCLENAVARLNAQNQTHAAKHQLARETILDTEELEQRLKELDDELEEKSRDTAKSE